MKRKIPLYIICLFSTTFYLEAQNVDILDRYVSFVPDEIKLTNLDKYLQNDSSLQYNIDYSKYNNNWDLKRENIKSQLGELNKYLELTCSKYKLNENTIISKKEEINFLKNSIANSKNLLVEYKKQNTFLETYYSSIVNGKKFYGIFANVYEVPNDKISKDINLRSFHEYAEDKTKEYVFKYLTSSFVKDSILVHNGLVEKTTSIIKNAESFNLVSSYPIKIIYKNKNIIITLIALSIGSQGQIDPQSKYLQADSVYSNIKSENLDTKILFPSSDSDAALNSIISLKMDEKNEIGEWFNNAKSKIIDNDEQQQRKNWEKEVNNYLHTRDELSNQVTQITKDTIRNSLKIATLTREIFLLDSLNRTEILNWTEYKKNYNNLEYELYDMLKSRSYYGFTSLIEKYANEDESVNMVTYNSLKEAISGITQNEIMDLRKIYLQDIKNVNSSYTLKTPINSSINKLSIFDYSQKSGTKGKIKVTFSIGYKLNLQIDPQYIRKIPQPCDPHLQSQFTITDTGIIDNAAKLIWKRLKIDSIDNNYGNSCLLIDIYLSKANTNNLRWRLPRIHEMELLSSFIFGIDELTLGKHDILVPNRLPYWTDPVTIGKHNTQFRKAVYFSNNSITVVDLNITEPGYYLIVRDL